MFRVPLIAAFMPLVPLASLGASRVVEPDVVPLNHEAGDVDVVVLEEEQAPGERLLARQRHDVADQFLAGEQHLQRLPVALHQGREAVGVSQQQGAALVGGEAAGETEGEDVVQPLQGSLRLGRGDALAPELTPQVAPRDVEQALAADLADLPQLSVGHPANRFHVLSAVGRERQAVPISRSSSSAICGDAQVWPCTPLAIAAIGTSEGARSGHR